MSMNTEQITMYILMRNDLDSLNPGKACAQAAHAANLAVHFTPKTIVERWIGSGQYAFNKTIVLEASPNEIGEVVQNTEFSGWVYDPTYPVRDGAVTHLVPLHTCAYVLCGPSEAELSGLSKLPLMR